MILGLIPARGGSKGILKKNIKLIAGKPLISWTIEAAQKSTMLDKIVVSTDSKEIADIAARGGADILTRPDYLATDKADTLDVMIHALKEIPSDTLVLLQPTSPIRKDGLIDECISEFLAGNYDSLATGFMCQYIEYGKNDLRRQDIEGFFYDDGNVYVMKGERILKKDRYGTRICRKIISRAENAEIDDEFDFWLCQKILENSSLYQKEST
jgi:CMP-N-acetylneuraminic acid synthetase